MTIRAVYEKGMFRPIGQVELPDNCEVEFEPRVVDADRPAELDEIYQILSRRFDSGHHDTAERHDEHQP